jgi:hypothetical protein
MRRGSLTSSEIYGISREAAPNPGEDMIDLATVTGELSFPAPVRITTYKAPAGSRAV